MDPAEYLREHVCTPGSTLYYATLFTPPQRKLGLLSILALQRELSAIPRSCSDPGIARVRLQWWREELRTAHATQQAHHPLTQGLALFCPAVLEHGITRLLASIDAAERTLNAPRAHTHEELRNRYECSHGELLALGRLTAEPRSMQFANDECMVRLGGLLGLNEALQTLPLHVQQGLLPLPSAEMPSPRLPRREAEDKAWQAFLRHYAQFVRDELQQVLDQIPPRQRLAELHAIIVARIVLSIWTEIIRDGTLLLTQSTDLTPLRKLWIAWREFRTATRNQA